MEPNELLSVSPEFLAKAIIHRRERLLELIPSELEQAQALQMEAEQNSRNAKQSRDEINQKVANLKKERNHAQNEAKQLFEQSSKARDELIEKGEMKNPEPKWAKDKLSNKIQRIEEKIQTTGGNHKTEEKFINEMKALIKEHEEWVAQRANASPLMNEMKRINKQRRNLLLLLKRHIKAWLNLSKRMKIAILLLLDGKKKEGDILHSVGNSQLPKNPVKRRSDFGEKHWKKGLKHCSSMRSVSKMVDNLRSHCVKRTKGVRKNE